MPNNTYLTVHYLHHNFFFKYCNMNYAFNWQENFIQNLWDEPKVDHILTKSYHILSLIDRILLKYSHDTNYWLAYTNHLYFVYNFEIKISKCKVVMVIIHPNKNTYINTYILNVCTCKIKTSLMIVFDKISWIWSTGNVA